MSIFPDLPGVKIEATYRPEFSTLIRRSTAGNEYRVAQRSAPKWRIALAFEFLRAGAESELQTLVNFFLARKGTFEAFEFTHPDNAITGQGVTLTVRFVNDAQDFERFLDDLWSARKVELATL